MPAGDGTGPMGEGSMTGRGAGLCVGYDAPGYANPMPGRGLGMGRGRRWAQGMGRRWRRWFSATGLPGRARFHAYRPAWRAAPPSREQEVDTLRSEAQWLKGELDAIGRRIKELEQE